ncbi:MAG: FAD-binding oxidoreductase [Cupriavidus sp.]|uniref:FAD-binding oxidoreductase n=1 Tax=Cupriavidus pauculus TaxID=82633 RepID=UPI000C5D9CA8|nr:FAD-binding oxidoreductase [Cupriavidus pauculus]MBU70430.1 FAD-binding oxidoreductase [Cupriavidus sp.]
MTRQTVFSWGRTAPSESDVLALPSRFDALPALRPDSPSMLPFGNGRSYGDSCLNPGGTLLSTRYLDHFIAFDAATGVLRCEAGVLLSDILKLIVPQGWFLPVTPGTRFVTVGGAIANDVHGKNHLSHGTFGRHVRALALRRSDGATLQCSPHENADWFAATIGGLGLTGVVLWAEIQMRPIASPWVEEQTERFASLDQFFALCRAYADTHEYTVAWIDCSAGAHRVGRGLFTRARHAPADAQPPRHGDRPRSRSMPFTPPFSLVNRLSVGAFNTLHYHRTGRAEPPRLTHCDTFFYPLDHILQWHRMYGPKGFYQYQCVVPPEDARAALHALLSEIGRSGAASFLGVLKQFGPLASPGLLSFPREGFTLALDFPNAGPRLHALFERLDAIVAGAGGRLYPAKDGRMSGACFRAGYPQWEALTPYIDPAFSSGFWRRVTDGATHREMSK